MWLNVDGDAERWVPLLIDIARRRGAPAPSIGLLSRAGGDGLVLPTTGPGVFALCAARDCF